MELYTHENVAPCNLHRINVKVLGNGRYPHSLISILAVYHDVILKLFQNARFLEAFPNTGLLAAEWWESYKLTLLLKIKINQTIYNMQDALSAPSE